MDFTFLKSVRFWKLFVVAVAAFLATQGVISVAVSNLIEVWLGGSVVLGTVDKFGKNFAG